jgi:group I intron endonuclease
MIVYKVTNNINQKLYVGKTELTLVQRKAGHYQRAAAGSETNFHRALRLYNKTDFTWEVLCECSSEEELDSMERFFIEQYDTFRTGYNMTAGGDGGVTYKKGDVLYERIKQKLGKWKLGNPGATPAAIQKRVKSFVDVNWPKGTNHKNSGHSHNKGKTSGSRNAMFGKTPHLQSVEIDNEQYDSLGAASRAIGVSRATVRNRCLSNLYPTWRLLGVTKQSKF